MTRKLKSLGVALLAVFAMSAVAASTASAVTQHTFNLTGMPMTLTGFQHIQNKFTILGQSITCTTVDFHATVIGTSSEINTISPTYTGCSFGGLPIAIVLNGCRYGFTGTTNVANHATVRIEDCDTDKHIEATIPAINCNVTIKHAIATDGNQTAEEGVKYTQIGTPHTATAELTIDLTTKLKINIDQTIFPPNVLCDEFTGATTIRLTGSILLTGETDTGSIHTGIWFTTD